MEQIWELDGPESLQKYWFKKIPLGEFFQVIVLECFVCFRIRGSRHVVIVGDF